VIVLDTDCPDDTLISALESEKSKDGGGALTVNVKVVGWDREPDAPVTVIVDVPVGVDPVVAASNVEEMSD